MSLTIVKKAHLIIYMVIQANKRNLFTNPPIKRRVSLPLLKFSTKEQHADYSNKIGN